MASLKAVYPSGSKFKKIVQALARVNDEGTFHFSTDGLSSWVFSPDKTILGIFKVSSTGFEELSVDSDISLTVNIGELSKVLRRSTRNDKIILEYTTGNSYMKVSLIDEKTGVERSFEISSGESEGNEIKEIKMNPTVRFILSAGDIDTLIKDAKLVGDIIKITGKEDQIIAEASGEEKFYQWIMKKDSPLQELNIDEESSSSYSLSSLKSTLEPITTIAESVSLEFTSDYPLKIEFSVSGPEEFIIYVAPVSS
ncbi:DNA polymerase sliding clamp subunit [Caldisphaera lagunensis DSM 15908]|uniref:DNA polymerase sliding clamp n=1 Tax=Caldisphaera lagunensis (strain DSM 15908 / JCM 11604 / ANMR 0165 / IC-154) TaxID=1056495 RepID=L0ADB5_CALLD|nr:DNA polymerase sliding clamp [Caldisphaera lagunensis]AFZ71102.1 DNA polymerase sliding clamp subunit [Caldisphaera lagunensis DSM 15908]